MVCVSPVWPRDQRLIRCFTKSSQLNSLYPQWSQIYNVHRVTQGFCLPSHVRNTNLDTLGEFLQLGKENLTFTINKKIKFKKANEQIKKPLSFQKASLMNFSLHLKK